MIKAGILGLGRAVPDKILTNADLERMVDTSDEWITTRTGIKERRIVENEKTSDLAIQASAVALERAGLEPSQIDLIIVATITPDHAFPATACIVQAELGCVNAGAFDLSAGCSGFVYALETAASLVQSGAHRHVLVIGADTLSTITDFTDRSTCVLFGDGAGAAVVGPVQGRGIIATHIGADGTGAENLCLPRRPSENGAYEDGYIHMAGNDVFRFAVRVMADATKTVLERAHIDASQIDLFVPHQANIRIIDAAAKRLGIEKDNIFVNVQHYGNTSAASIPIALTEAYETERMKQGDLITLVGFGAGLTWASAVLEWE